MELRDYIFVTNTATICSSKDGHMLHEGDVTRIENWLLNCEMVFCVVSNNNTYIEVRL